MHFLLLVLLSFLWSGFLKASANDHYDVKKNNLETVLKKSRKFSLPLNFGYDYAEIVLDPIRVIEELKKQNRKNRETKNDIEKRKLSETTADEQ
jgi:hypothetical protein